MKPIFAVIAIFYVSTAFAAPTITGVEPGQGFTFTTTHVTIRGTGFVDDATSCGPGTTCPVAVMIGSQQAVVTGATSVAVNAIVSPQAEGVVDVTVMVTGKGQAMLSGAFRFSPFAITTPADYATYLVPVILRNLPGANGSEWTTELKIRNRWDRRIPIITPACGPAGPDPCFEPILFDAKSTSELALFTRGDGTDGAFLHVPITLNDPIPAMTLRVRDLSKNATSFGTEIHLPKLDEYQGVVDLIDVPTDARYRATLRAYGSSEAPQQVRVRVFTAGGTLPIDERVRTLNGIVTFAPTTFPYNPSYLQLDPLTPAVRASGDRVRVTVDVMGENVSPPPPPVWAFVTITDNVTQLVSTITPSR